jgi:GT2 family glycosyltransferase
MRPLVDIVTVFHNQKNKAEALATLNDLLDVEDSQRWRWVPVDNRVQNRGFAAGCNLGAAHGTAPVIGFLNPDVEIRGPFLDAVRRVLGGPVVITGCRFGKPDLELRAWGVRDWVCGAAFFVTRQFFEEMGGFDEQFVWGWEETDLIRRAQAHNLRVRSIPLPIHHVSPDVDSPSDTQYKRHHFEKGAARFKAKWHG